MIDHEVIVTDDFFMVPLLVSFVLARLVMFRQLQFLREL